MCIPNRQLDPKSRRRTVIANISVVLGLSLWLCVHPTGQLVRNCLHGATGFLLGLAVTILVVERLRARRCRKMQEGAQP